MGKLTAGLTASEAGARMRLICYDMRRMRFTVNAEKHQVDVDLAEFEICVTDSSYLGAVKATNFKLRCKLRLCAFPSTPSVQSIYSFQVRVRHILSINLIR